MRDGHRDDRPTLVLRIVRDVLLAGALIAVTSPWTSGLYTWVQQSRLADAFARPGSAPATEAVASEPHPKAHPHPGPFDAALEGWERDDAATWRGLPDGAPFARLSIPRIGLDVTVLKGVTDADLRRGPGWLTSTDLPGATGNVGISGHRTTWLAPFQDIDQLRSGDVIRLTSRYRVYTYRMTGRLFVEPSDADVFTSTTPPTLTLTACHPKFSDRFRIVIRARLSGVTRR
jgi:LPXTG-site transpeptidase (sortase) family protein